MKYLHRYLLLIPTVLLTINVVLAVNGAQSFLFQLFTLFCLLFLPGFLIFLSIKHDIEGNSFWPTVLHSIGLSILHCYVVGLISSVVLPRYGIARPLDFQPLIYLLHVPMLLFNGIAVGRRWNDELDIHSLKSHIIDAGLYGFGGFVSLLSIAGAFALNISAQNSLTLSWLTMILLAFMAVSFFPSQMVKKAYPFFLFALSLSLLWSLSARSWHLVGWDIIQELYTARLTQLNGAWHPRLINDAYNACLSITILPTILSNVTGIAIANIFKYFYPFIFAHFSIILYFLLKKVADRKAAFLAVFYVIAQPFFIQPMIALARQEIAFVFFALVLYMAFTNYVSKKAQVILTCLYIFAMVVSHYSTTYVSILLFVPVFLISVGTFLFRFIPVPKQIFQMQFYQNWITNYRSEIRWWVILCLLTCTYVWYFQVTPIGNKASSAFIDTLSSLSRLFEGDQKSQEVQQALPGAKKVVHAESILQMYIDTNTQNLSNLSPEKRAEIARRYPLQVLSDTFIKPTIPGKQAELVHGGLDRFKDVLKILSILGAGILFLKTFQQKYTHQDYIAFTVVSTGVLLVMVLHPTIGLQYNISRIYLQLMTFLSLALILGIETILWKTPKLVKEGVLVLSIGISFFYLQGLLTPIIGGVPPLQFYNQGTDYEKFFPFEGEFKSAQWLQDNRNYKNTVYADDLSGLRIRRVAFFFTNTSLVPGALANNASSYVYLSDVNKNLGKAQVNSDSKFLTFFYPKKFLEENKNRIYSNNRSEIYR